VKYAFFVMGSGAVMYILSLIIRSGIQKFIRGGGGD
jgi:hypothetical protein